MSRCFLNTLQRYYFEQAKARKKCIVMLVESVERAFKTSPSPFQGERRSLTPAPSTNGITPPSLPQGEECLTGAS